MKTNTRKNMISKEVESVIHQHIRASSQARQNISATSCYQLICNQIHLMNENRNDLSKLKTPSFSTVYNRLRSFLKSQGSECSIEQENIDARDNDIQSSQLPELQKLEQFNHVYPKTKIVADGIEFVQPTVNRYPQITSQENIDDEINRRVSPFNHMEISRELMDLHLVDENSGKPVGRAVMTTILDVYSGVQSFVLEVDPPSNKGVMDALRRTIIEAKVNDS
ncbi:hypothetical protein [Paenibacillus protaetiae]|uniref:Uncharacterized protein n=1 Tax=Paenibacillus protaetiae TaxID=2509456 RepID=A0A4P6F037_9BACL|nr:hypothetical protein [Paenibacillus protaetiae]QAY66347.1 hypothetical protein ET464_07950 [Paenibacillus protaetiae]